MVACKGAHFPQLQSHAVVQLPHFPQTISPTHQCHTYTCDTISKLAEDDIGTLEIFFVKCRYKIELPKPKNCQKQVKFGQKYIKRKQNSVLFQISVQQH